ncbi:MAG: hypothetical protein KBD78_02605 [Oligoflexales bacterium]|nr:hypothetical protein [Oligoflexales bacterium]
MLGSTMWQLGKEFITNAKHSYLGIPSLTHGNMTSSFSEYLPYEAVIPLERPTYLLKDGSLCVGWQLKLLSHELMSESELTESLKALRSVFEKIDHDKVSFQLIFASEPSAEFTVPVHLNAPKTVAEDILAERVKAIQSFADSPGSRQKLIKRELILTMRIGSLNPMASRFKLLSKTDELSHEAQSYYEQSKLLMQFSEEIEYTLGFAKMEFNTLSPNAFIHHLRGFFHHQSSKDLWQVKDESPLREDLPLSEQVLRDFIGVSPRAITAGQDVWEVASWIEQPPTTFNGLLTRLCEISEPIRVVLNLRPCLDTSDLDTKMVFLKNATDAFGELQKTEIKDVQDKLARGNKLIYSSLHVLVRTKNCDLGDLNDKSTLPKVIAKLRTLTGIDFLHEKYAAPALLLSCLPFGFSAAAAQVSGREKRILSRSLAAYLPVFDGFLGTKTPMQLMTSRAGNALWLSPFDSETSPHVALLASSGGGKSFFTQNMMMSFLAQKRPADGIKPMIFIIDKKTSYEIFAKVAGEEFGSEIIKPPAYFPNIFKGELDELRLPIIVGLLKTAISLVSQDLFIGAVEEMLLATAIKSAFDHNELDANFAYGDGHFKEVQSQQRRTPRLSDIVQNLFPIAAKLDIPQDTAAKLAANFAPFIGNGPYAALFDQTAMQDSENVTPGVTLYDIDAVASNPVLSTITSQMILSEIIRQVRKPENVGRPGLLVIEEVGVLAAGSKELVAFIQDAWKTFRKLGICCIGLTNEVDDYLLKNGPREIWNVSPNKIFLKMSEKDLDKAVLGEVPLITDSTIGQVLRTLVKKDGEFSQGLWWSDVAKGTFIYNPTGFDYWCAASKPIEVNTVYKVAGCFSGSKKPFFLAAGYLSQHFPLGVRHGDGSLRALTDEELSLIKQGGVYDS